MASQLNKPHCSYWLEMQFHILNFDVFKHSFKKLNFVSKEKFKLIKVDSEYQWGRWLDRQEFYIFVLPSVSQIHGD